MTSPSLAPPPLESEARSLLGGRLLIYPHAYLPFIFFLPLSYLMANALWEEVSLLPIVVSALVILLQILFHELCHGIATKVTGGTFHALVMKPFMVAVRVTHYEGRYEDLRKAMVAAAGPCGDLLTATLGGLVAVTWSQEVGTLMMIWGVWSALINMVVPHHMTDGYRLVLHLYRGLRQLFTSTRNREVSVENKAPETAS